MEGENPKPTTACREAANASQTHTQVCACRKGAVRCVTQQDDAFFLFDLIFFAFARNQEQPSLAESGGAENMVAHHADQI